MTPNMNCISLTRGRTGEGLNGVSVSVLMLAFTWVLTAQVNARILQTENPLELRPPSGSQSGIYFGFSLAHYINKNQRWLLVGAPRSPVSSPDVSNSGGLYQCPLNDPTGTHECQEMNVELADTLQPWLSSNNSEQSLGFSLASSDQEIVVCAPRWYATKTLYNKKSYLPAGMCYTAQSPGYEFKVLSPSPPFETDSSKQISFLTTGYCQFGMSATYVKSQNTFALGGPGCWAWQGDMWEVEPNTNSPRRHLGKLSNPPLDLAQGNWQFHNLYLGYSIASLKLGGATGTTVILSSMPRAVWQADGEASKPFGPAVLILGEDPENKTALIVEQIISPSEVTAGSEVLFSFFGYSIATLDVNGDGLEDLVVGAPLYHRPTAQSQGSDKGYDYGAIFVYMQTAIESHESGRIVYQMKEENNAPKRIGSVPFSRFGSCVVGVGDLDGDGYEDLAVGAPFMTEEGAGTGAIYIYMGSSKGLEEEPFQVIKAASGQHGLGSSIAQQLPVVEAKGFDVAVGLYDSDKVLVFKSIEVVEVAWNLTFSEPIKLSEKRCYCSKFEALCPCVDANVCLQWKKKFSKVEQNELSFNVTLSIQKSYDLFFDNSITKINKTTEANEGETKCLSFRVMAKPDLEEIKTYIFRAELSLAKEENEIMLDRHSELTKDERLEVFIQCTSKNVSGCLSDVNLQYEVLDSYVYDSRPLRIEFTVKNRGETAYDSRLIIKSEDNFKIMRSDTTETVNCEQRGSNNGIECRMGHLGNNSEVVFTLKLTPYEETLEPSVVDKHEPFFAFQAYVETISSIINAEAANKNIHVNISVEGSVRVFRKASDPSIVNYNSSSYYKPPESAKNEAQLGPEIKHKYAILNDKDFSFSDVDLIIHWPHKIDGKYFLYLMEKPEFTGIRPTCTNTGGEVDPLHLADKPTRVSRSTEDPSNVVKASAFAMEVFSKSPEFITITCHVGRVEGNTEINFVVRSRLVMRTLVELGVGTAVKNASSFVDLQINKMPFNVASPPASHADTTTEISYKIEEPEIKIPVWLYIVSALGGLLVLAVIAFTLWKCGFFKRKRTETPAPDKRDNQEPEEPNEENQAETRLMEGQEEEVKTPNTPLLSETECADEDFVYTKGNKATQQAFVT